MHPTEERDRSWNLILNKSANEIDETEIDMEELKKYHLLFGLQYDPHNFILKKWYFDCGIKTTGRQNICTKIGPHDLLS